LFRKSKEMFFQYPTIFALLLVSIVFTAVYTGDSFAETSGAGNDLVDLTSEEKAWARSNSVKVGVEEWPPIIYVANNNQIGGMAGGYLDLVSRRTGLKFEIVGNAWNPLLSGLRDHTIDLLPATYYTDERATYGLYTKPYFLMKEFVYVRSDNQAIKSLDDLANGRIAVVKGYGTIPKLKEYLPDATIIETADQLASVSAVLNGEADALVEAQMAVQHVIKANGIVGLKGISQNVFPSSPIHFFSRGDEPLLQSILQKGLDSITEAEQRSLQRKWLFLDEGTSGRVTLTLEERSWLAAHSNIRVGDDFAWPPFTFKSADGDMSGIAAGYMEALAERLDVNLKPVWGLSWTKVLEEIRDGGLDILPAVARTPERDAFLNFTKPYISFPVVIATRKDGAFVDGLNDLKGLKAGVVAGYVTEELLTKDYPEIPLQKFKNLREGLRAVQKGDIDAFVDNLGSITYEIDREKLTNLKIAAPTDYRFDLSIGVRKDWPELVTILDKALATIDDKERTAIKNAWMAINVSYGTDMKTILIWVVPIAIGLAIFIGFIIFWNRRLGHEIDEHKRTQNALTERRRTLAAVLENTVQAIVAVDKDYNLVACNKRFQNLLSLPDDLTISGTSTRAMVEHAASVGFYGDGDIEQLVETRMKALTSGQPLRVEINATDGNIWYATLDMVDEGGFVMTYTDITERKIAELKLKDAYSVISSSINYASRIQRSILPDDSLMVSVCQDEFIIWEPRDVVGGDMYWCREWGEGTLIILGDCTGHGVPGAFMTLIMTGSLDRAIEEAKVGDVAALLQRMHQFAQTTLSQNEDRGESDDGMELGICYLPKDKVQLYFTGARFELFEVYDNQVSITKSTKKGIGYRKTDYEQLFEVHKIPIRKNQSFYMTSDGLTDQVGGGARRMYGKKRFTKLLLEIQDRPMCEQKQIIHQSLIDYQGDENRRDDVSLLGFKISA
jgi:ABC-type amino acid transport substrate-binding protein/serine phosphatase RsbU (regulator of sigma subunit)